jgi:hypothetical protein
MNSRFSIPEQTRYQSIPFTGSSMRPLISPRCKELLVDFDVTKSKKLVGEIVLFKDESEWVCHRYLGETQGKHVFKGDFSTTYEEKTKFSSLATIRGFIDEQQVYFFKKSALLSVVVFLQKKSVLTSNKLLRKFYRYCALAVLHSFRPFFILKSSQKTS